MSEPLLDALRLACQPCNPRDVIAERSHDAYGQLLVAALEGDDVVEIVERNDGFISASALGPKMYLAPFRFAMASKIARSSDASISGARRDSAAKRTATVQAQAYRLVCDQRGTA